MRESEKDWYERNVCSKNHLLSRNFWENGFFLEIRTTNRIRLKSSVKIELLLRGTLRAINAYKISSNKPHCQVPTENYMINKAVERF